MLFLSQSAFDGNIWTTCGYRTEILCTLAVCMHSSWDVLTMFRCILELYNRKYGRRRENSVVEYEKLSNHNEKQKHETNMSVFMWTLFVFFGLPVDSTAGSLGVPGSMLHQTKNNKMGGFLLSHHGLFQPAFYRLSPAAHILLARKCFVALAIAVLLVAFVRNKDVASRSGS